MENNAMILGDLESLLNVLDARTHITIWNQYDGKQHLVFSNTPVYEVLHIFNGTNSLVNYKVVGINLGIATSIMVEPARENSNNLVHYELGSDLRKALMGNGGA